MRLVLAFLLFATPAVAECDFDPGPGRSVASDGFARETAQAIDCLEEQIAGLEAANAALLARLEDLEAIAALIPSTYAADDGRGNGATAPYASASFDLTARPRGRAFDVALDHAVILDLCADAEGCLLSLASTSETARAAPDLGRIGPCAFTYEAETGAWSLQPACGGLTGIDGDGRLPGSETPDRVTVMAIGSECALTESALDLRADDAGNAALARDRDQGFFLISGLTAGDTAPPASDYVCRLSIRD